MSERIPILMYHDVTPTPIPGFEFYSVTSKAFGAQMRLLAWMGYSAIGFDEYLDRVSSRKPLPPRTVLLTFDDGFQSCIESAVPHLKKFGFTATFFVVAGLVGRGSQWLRPRLGRELPLAGWDTLRQLTEGGIECGAHGLTHTHLTTLSPDACRFEITESKRILEERLGRPVRHMAYPYGAYNPLVRSVAEETGYATACAVRGGHSGLDDDLLALRRIVISGYDSLADFACRLRTGKPVREFLRQKVRSTWLFGRAAQ